LVCTAWHARQFFDFARAAASCANALVDATAATATNNIKERFIS
jgi:hypothetical protein